MADIKFVSRSTERIRPFSPTPQSLRSYNLSLFDQLFNLYYTPIVLFYNSSGNHDQLKGSFSKMLSNMYPLAGRIKDGKTIDCNDEGADFVVAQVESKMSEVMQYPTLDRLRMLFPCNPDPGVVDSTIPMLAVQVTRFACGGCAVAVCFWHGLADAAGIVGFLNTWAAINRGQEQDYICANGDSLVVDSSTTFVPCDLCFPPVTDRNQIMVAEKYVIKKFVLRGSVISGIRDEYNTQSAHRPTRVEAMATFLWGAVIRATREWDRDLDSHMLTMAVDLRKRLNPPFPPYCLGNINQQIGARWEKELLTVDSGTLLERVQEAIRKIDDDYIRKMHVDGGYLKAIAAVIGTNGKRKKSLCMSSWCRIPFYEVDFGWGKPKWISHIHVLRDQAILVDMDDGGVEVCLGLPQDIMCHLEKDKQFQDRISYSQTVWDDQYNNLEDWRNGSRS